MYQYADAEAAFNDCVDIAQDVTNNPDVIYSHYHNLFTFNIKANLKNGILMGKALMSEEERKDIPLVYQKDFLFNLGTAYLLNGNYADSKKVFRECLNMKPQLELRARLLNNMAVSYWWHKIPLYEMLDNKENNAVNSDYPSEDIEKEFNTVISLLKKSLEATETSMKDFANKDEQFKTRFVELIDPSQAVPSNLEEWQSQVGEETLINNPDSIKALLNITEFLLVTGGDESIATFWIKHGLKIAESLDVVDKARL